MSKCLLFHDWSKYKPVQIDQWTNNDFGNGTIQYKRLVNQRKCQRCGFIQNKLTI